MMQEGSIAPKKSARRRHSLDHEIFARQDMRGRDSREDFPNVDMVRWASTMPRKTDAWATFGGALRASARHADKPPIVCFGRMIYTV